MSPDSAQGNTICILCTREAGESSLPFYYKVSITNCLPDSICTTLIPQPASPISISPYHPHLCLQCLHQCLQSVIYRFGYPAGQHTITESCRQQTEQYAKGTHFFKRAWRALRQGINAGNTFCPRRVCNPIICT